MPITLKKPKLTTFKDKALRHFKVDPVLKFMRLFISRLNLCDIHKFTTHTIYIHTYTYIHYIYYTYIHYTYIHTRHSLDIHTIYIHTPPVPQTRAYTTFHTRIHTVYTYIIKTTTYIGIYPRKLRALAALNYKKERD